MKIHATGSVLAAVLLILATGACTSRTQWHQSSGSVWGTTWHITYRAADNLDDSVLAVMQQVSASLSAFDTTSLVSAVNRGEPVAADTLMKRVMAASRRVWQASGGAFDPTVAPLVNLWGFGWKGDGGFTAPASGAIDSVLSTVGMGGCGIGSDGLVYKTAPGTQFDFSAIAKGLGCDLVAEMLTRNGCSDYMVEIGGEIAVGGHNRHGEYWHLLIDDPLADDMAAAVPGRRGLCIIGLDSGGMATSGNYRNWRDTDRGRVGHTISPLTGMPVYTGVLSATIVAADCMTADALATASMAMGRERALAMADSLDVAALLAVADTDSTFTLAASRRWQRQWPINETK